MHLNLAMINGARMRRVGTLAAGWTLLLAGTVLLVLPGPGIPLMLAGLALLGRELAWARKLRERIQAKIFRRPPAAA
jgi:hypothetical protein